MSACPNCGYRHANSDYAPELTDIRLQNRRREILLRLSQAQGGWVAKSSLIDFLWGDDIDGGPNDENNVIQSHVSSLRREIQKFGWTVECERFRGYRLVRSTQ